MQTSTHWVVLIAAISVIVLTFSCGEFVGSAGEGEKLIVKYGCRDCHVVKGEGADKAPDLDTVIGRVGEIQVRKQIKDPKSVNPDSVMPQYGFSEKEQDQILSYLREIQK
jgi:cytochrome c2